LITTPFLVHPQRTQGVGPGPAQYSPDSTIESVQKSSRQYTIGSARRPSITESSIDNPGVGHYNISNDCIIKTARIAYSMTKADWNRALKSQRKDGPGPSENIDRFPSIKTPGGK
jgi:hypothetical protein